MILSDPKGIPRSADEMQYCIDTGYVIPAFRDASKITVEMLLDYVDLKLDWYIPSIEAFDFVNFIRLCVGEEPENLNPKSHYFFIDCMFQSPEVKPYFTVRNMDFDELKGNTLILSSREYSKSTLIAYLVLYMADKGKMPRFGKVNFGMYVSDKMDGNVKTTMQTLEALYLGSAYLKSRFEWTHFTDAAVELIRKPRSPDEIKVYNKHMSMPSGKIETVPGRMNRKFKMQGLGSSGGRGSRSGLDRPQFAIFDDMVANEKDAYSKAILDSIDSTIEADVGSSLSGEGHFQILIGTAYHTGDPVYKRVTEGTFLPVVFPKAEVPPHNGIYDKTGKMIEPPMTKERFVSVWPDRHSFEKQKKAYSVAERAAAKGKTKKLKTINQEFYVRVTSEHERLIGAADLRWANVQHVKDNAQNYSWYVTTDYTTTANKGSDDSVQMLWAVEWTGRRYLMMIYGGKQIINEQYENTLKMVRKATSWGANMVEVGVEIDGQQVLHLIGLQRYADDNNVPIIFARQKEKLGKTVTWEGIRSKGSGNKLWRLHLVAGDFHDGNVIFDEDMKDFNPFMETFLGELKMTTGTEIKADSDNYLDGTSQIALIDILVPEKPVQVKRGYNSIKFDPTFMSHDRVPSYDDNDDGYY